MSTRKRQWWTVILATFVDGSVETYTIQVHGTPKSAVAKAKAFRDEEYGLDPKGPGYVKPELVGLVEGEHYNDAYILNQ